MQESGVIETVRERGTLESTDEATETTVVVLEALGERIPAENARAIASGLPQPIGEHLTDSSGGESPPVSFDDFVDRVRDGADVDAAEAVKRARVAVDALSETSDADELRAVEDQLPDEFDQLFGFDEEQGEREFLDVVERRADLESTDEARTAAAATLETLAERISAGQAADLAVYLPEPLAEPLREAEGDEPPDFGREEFLERVAGRGDVETDRAEERVRAVTDALSRTASNRELQKVIDQLPAQFGPLFEPAGSEG